MKTYVITFKYSNHISNPGIDSGAVIVVASSPESAMELLENEYPETPHWEGWTDAKISVVVSVLTEHRPLFERVFKWITSLSKKTK